MTTKPLPAELLDLIAPIAPALKEVEDSIWRDFGSRHEFINSLLGHISRFSGKRLRPILCLYGGLLCGDMNEDHVKLSVICEIVHTATLVHDDILDESQTRRRVETVHSKWNNETAVLLGDYLFSHAFHLSLVLDTKLAARELSKATNIVVEGELLQVHNRNNFNLGEAEYYDIIRKKTAELCAVSGRLGAIYGGATEEDAAKFHDYCLNFGMAFQIMDDYLDIMGKEEEVGKTLGTDTAKGKMTLPTIRLLAVAEAEDKRKIQDLLAGLAKQPTPEAALSLRSYMDRYGAVKYAFDKAGAYIDSALRSLEIFGNEDIKEKLRRLAKYALERKM